VFSTTQPDPATFEMPPSPPLLPVGPARLAQNLANGGNNPFWLAIGCMALAIVALLVILALMAGLFVGRGGAAAITVAGLMLVA
jgi:hypothetical protein